MPPLPHTLQPLLLFSLWKSQRSANEPVGALSWWHNVCYASFFTKQAISRHICRYWCMAEKGGLPVRLVRGRDLEWMECVLENYLWLKSEKENLSSALQNIDKAKNGIEVKKLEVMLLQVKEMEKQKQQRHPRYVPLISLKPSIFVFIKN